MRERRRRGCEKKGGVLGEHGEAYADDRIATFLPAKAENITALEKAANLFAAFLGLSMT